MKQLIYCLIMSWLICVSLSAQNHSQSKSETPWNNPREIKSTISDNQQTTVLKEQFSADGKIVSAMLYNGKGELMQGTTFTYDKDGKLHSKTEWNNQGEVYDSTIYENGKELSSLTISTRQRTNNNHNWYIEREYNNQMQLIQEWLIDSKSNTRTLLKSTKYVDNHNVGIPNEVQTFADGSTRAIEYELEGNSHLLKKTYLMEHHKKQLLQTIAYNKEGYVSAIVFYDRNNKPTATYYYNKRQDGNSGTSVGESQQFIVDNRNVRIVSQVTY